MQSIIKEFPYYNNSPIVKLISSCGVSRTVNVSLNSYLPLLSSLEIVSQWAALPISFSESSNLRDHQNFITVL